MRELAFLVKEYYRGIDLLQFTHEQIERKALLIKRQKEILSFANTEAGKHFLFIDKTLKDLPIVSVTPNAVIQVADWKNNKSILTADFWADERIANRVITMLDYLDIARENKKYKRIIKENPYTSFLHFADYKHDKRLPAIYLTNQDFSADATGKRNLQYNASTNFATTRAFSGTASNSSDIGFGSNASNYLLSRMFMPTDFSAIGAGATGISATVKVTASTRWDDTNDANGFATVIISTQASNTILNTDEFDNVNHTDKSTSGHLDYTSATADGATFNNLALSDVSDITGTGYTKYGLQDGHDLNNTANAITAGGGQLNQLRDTKINAKTNVTWTPAERGGAQAVLLMM